jgi:RHS repeat-associated protein
LSGVYTGNNIIVENNVNLTGTARLKAGISVTLKPGFRAAQGCSLIVSIDTTLVVEPEKYYYVKDHLGSTRVTVDEEGEIASYYDYDPWGMVLDGRSNNYGITNEKYKFTGKERDDETNYDYFGARYYDARIGRWLQVDQLAEKYPGWSTFSYCLDNSIMSIDPTGKDVKIKNNSNGTVPKGFSSTLPKRDGRVIEVQYKSINNSTLNYLENQINTKFVGEWKDPLSPHYAPAMAKFVEKNDIPLGIISGMEDAYGSYYDNTILVRDDVVKNGIIGSVSFEEVTFHELIHYGVFGSGNELEAYAAEFAANYSTYGEIKSSVNQAQLTKGFKTFLNDRKIESEEDFKRELYNYGKTLIGK